MESLIRELHLPEPNEPSEQSSVQAHSAWQQMSRAGPRLGSVPSLEISALYDSVPSRVSRAELALLTLPSLSQVAYGFWTDAGGASVYSVGAFSVYTLDARFSVHSNKFLIPNPAVLFAQEEKEIWRLLEIAQDWSIQEKMTYNVGKCGVLQHPVTVAEYQLCGSRIPVVSVYKYLGFPMTIDGIDYTAHVQTLADTVTGFLKFIQFDSSVWSCNTRWNLYRTFIRPQMEYGAPLIHCFKVSSKRRDFYKSLD